MSREKMPSGSIRDSGHEPQSRQRSRSWPSFQYIPIPSHMAFHNSLESTDQENSNFSLFSNGSQHCPQLPSFLGQKGKRWSDGHRAARSSQADAAISVLVLLSQISMTYQNTQKKPNTMNDLPGIFVPLEGRASAGLKRSLSVSLAQVELAHMSANSSSALVLVTLLSSIQIR